MDINWFESIMIDNYESKKNEPKKKKIIIIKKKIKIKKNQTNKIQK